MNATMGKRPGVLLFNPFVYVAGGGALGLGLAAILLAGLIGWTTNTHFDGVLDTHTGASAPLWFFLVEGLVDWLALGLVLLIAGRLISQTAFRTIDVLGTQALARWPTVLIALATLPPAFQRFSNSLVDWLKHGNIPKLSADAFVFGAAMLVMLVCTAWMVALMYRAFGVACNVKGGKAIGAFIVGLLLAEGLSKAALYGLVVSNLVTPMPGEAGAVAGASTDSNEVAVAQARVWLERIDDGRFAESWDNAAEFFRKAVPRQNWVQTMESFRKPLGARLGRELKLAERKTGLPGAPPGQYVVMQFQSSFAQKKDAVETVTVSLEGDGQWRVSGYFMK